MPPAGGARTRAKQRKPKTPAAALYYQSQGRDVARRSKPAPARPRVTARTLRTAPRVTGPRWQPSRTQLRSARAQERSYKSQGAAVRRVAKAQPRMGVGAPTPRVPILHERDVEKAARKRDVLKRGQQYASQGRAVEQRARQLNTKTAKVLAGQNLGKVVKPTRGLYNPKDVAEYAGLIDAKGLSAATKIFKTRKEVERAAEKAKAVKILEQVMRPGYASAGGARALVKGQSVGKALSEAKKGAQLKTRYLYSDVLKEAGVKNKTVRGIAGFGLDVALDPTTYVTFGTASVGGKGAAKLALRSAEKAAKLEAERLAPKVASGEMTKAQMKAAVRAKARDVQRKSLALSERKGTTGGPRGVTVRVAGGKHARKLIRKAGLESKRTPLAPLTRATVGARRAGSFVTPKSLKGAKAKEVRGGLRNAASEFHAGVRPTDITKSQQTTTKTLRREQRAEGEANARRIAARANALLGRLSDEEARVVIDAIENNKIGSLRGEAGRLKAEQKRRVVTNVRSRSTRKDPDRLFNVALQVRSDLRYLNRVGRRSGLLSGQVGKGGRTAADVKLSAAATPVRKTASREAKARQVAAQKVLRSARQRRFQTEAKGFFPRTRVEDVERSRAGLFERMAQGAEAPSDIKSAGVKAGTAERRQFRKTRAELAKGTQEERAVARALTGDIRETLSAYGTSVSRASSMRNLNTKLLQSGKQLTRNLSKGEFEALKKQGKSVYRVRRGVLEKVDDYAMANRASQSSRTRVALAQRVGALEREQADLLRRAEATKDKKAAAKLRVVADSKAREAAAVRKKIGVGGGGQYRILDDAVVREVRQQAPQSGKAGQLYDRAQAGFKSLALATPGYLVRNVLGDAFNAAVHENPFTLARNVVKGQRALNELGRYEKAAGRFEKELAVGKRTLFERGVTKARGGEARAPQIKLTKEQAAALGTSERKMSSFEAALLAEKMGVIRQGRFLELIEEGAKRPRGTHAWQNAVKRAEDSVRMTTFMGSLQRGLDPQEAATNASKIHFDYGDLTAREKKYLRRAMPFYTFTSRNIPLQARGLATRPGRYATVQKGREEGRKQSGLPVGYEAGLNPYEARQLGLPFKLGDKKFTISAAAPFTDLNDIAAAGSPFGAVEAGTRRVGEMLSPFIRTAPEMVFNLSLFYRDQIQRENEPYTRAPDWAIEMSKVPGVGAKFKKMTGLVDDYVPPEGGKVPGWGRKADYFFRQSFPGPISPLLEATGLGVKKGKNARNMEQWQRLLAAAGPRVIEYEPNRAKVERIYDRLEQVEAQLGKFRNRAHPTAKTPEGRPVMINADNPTPAFTKLFEEQKKLSRELDVGLRRARPGGFVGGEEVPTKQVAGALARRRGAAVRTRGASGRTRSATTRTRTR